MDKQIFLVNCIGSELRILSILCHVLIRNAAVGMARSGGQVDSRWSVVHWCVSSVDCSSDRSLWADEKMAGSTETWTAG